MKHFYSRCLFSVLLLGCLAMLTQCRAEQNTGMSEVLDSEPEKNWYNMDGENLKCETPPAGCVYFDHETEFVDLCVKNGGQSKTCGCAMLCSVKIEYTRQKPNPAAAVNKVPENADPSQVCSESERETLGGIIENRRPGSDDDRCIEDYLCQGTIERCQPASIPAVAKIRNLARNGCAAETVAGLCRNGYSESLQCPDDNIKQLSRLMGTLSDKKNPARRCTRNVLCFESEVSCDGSQKAEAQKFRRMLNKDGCEYWLRKLCSLEN